MYVCKFLRMYVQVQQQDKVRCVFIFTLCMYVHLYVCMYVRLYVRTYVHLYVCMYVHLYVYMSRCSSKMRGVVCVCVQNLCMCVCHIHICMNLHTHTHTHMHEGKYNFCTVYFPAHKISVRIGTQCVWNAWLHTIIDTFPRGRMP